MEEQDVTVEPDDMVIVVKGSGVVVIDPPLDLTEFQELIVVWLSDLAVPPSTPPKEELH